MKKKVLKKASMGISQEDPKKSSKKRSIRYEGGNTGVLAPDSLLGPTGVAKEKYKGIVEGMLKKAGKLKKGGSVKKK